VGFENLIEGNMITRDNYEEFFLLYIDNELSVQERSAVEEFVAANPDVQEEWDALLQCRVHPNRHEAFPDKELLLKIDLVSYIDGELDEAGRKAVEAFVMEYPSRAVELQQLSMTVSQADLSVVFPDKESLYRSDRRKLLLLPWMQAGIAAAVLGLVALLLFMSRHTTVDTSHLAKSAPVKKNAPAAVTPVTPAPLHSTGSDDQSRPEAIAKNDPQTRKELRKTQQPASAEKEKATAAIRQQEVAMTTTARTTPAANTTGSAATAVNGTMPVKSAASPGTMPVRSTAAAVNTSTAFVAATNPTVNASVAEVQSGAPGKDLIKPATPVTAVNIPKEQSSFATQALMEEAQADESKEILAASPAGKNKLRGLFRKVSRTFGKTAERDEDGQKEVLISAFQVELK
jgi:anti-sigma factor RsiW